MPPRWDMAFGVPGFDRRGRDAELCSHRPDTPELVENSAHLSDPSVVRLGHSNRTYGVRQSHLPCGSDFRTLRRMDAEEIRLALRRLGVKGQDIADAIGRDRTVVPKMLAGKRKIQVEELEPLRALIAKAERDAGERGDESEKVQDYVEVRVLPTFAGMGGGGTGDADETFALLPRRLIHDELRGKPRDFIMIDVRGNSMEPHFFQGDQILIDQRDRNPVQPGPFALRYDDGYVVKNVERRNGMYRVFSSNREYSDEEVDPADDRLEIMGRPVWFGRRV